MEYGIDYPFLVLVTGLIAVLTMGVKSGLRKTPIPPLVGYLLLGILLRLADAHWGFMSAKCREVLGFMARLGLITLLFRVGLESDPQGLLKQLRKASMVWVGDVLLSGLLGVAAAYYLLRVDLIPSLVVGTAFTATSVGISVGVWAKQGALTTPEGELLIDVAELDDISAVLLMGLLFSLLPTLLERGYAAALLPMLAKTTGLFLVKLFGFAFLCYLFSRWMEDPIMAYFKRLEPPSDFMVVVVGIGFIIAALAAILGFSLAIGAFFAGLVFCRDPVAVKREGSFLPFYELLSPFFFIGIGMDMDPATLASSLGMGTVLFAVAVVAKLLADGLPVWGMDGWKSATLIGVSMVPRAEIAMVVMQRGLKMELVSPGLFGAMIGVCTATCIVSPFLLEILLRRWPPQK